MQMWKKWNLPRTNNRNICLINKMEKNQVIIYDEGKYKEFADKFEALCNEFAAEDFDAREVKKVCEDIIDNYAD